MSMVNVIPDVYRDARYSGTETCRLLGICKETLRKYVMQGRIHKRYGRHSSRPYYLGKDIQMLWRTG